MDPMEPVYGAGTLLAIAAVAVAVLLVLIIKLRMHAFVALILVSLLTGLAAGIPFGDIARVATSFFGSTLGSVALLVGLGAMIGRLLEVTGGAQVLADTLITRFGEKRAPLALGVAALLFGIPIFFDAGLVVFLPIIFSVARRFGGSVLLYAIPAAGAFAAMHAIVPPHPGPVTAATELQGSIGLTVLVGLPVAFVAWYVGVYLFTQAYAGKVMVPIDDSFLRGARGAASASGSTDDADDDAPAGGSDGAAHPPSFGLVLGILLLPFVLIALNTGIDTLRKAEVLGDGTLLDALAFVGQTPVALLITLLVATYVLGTRGRSLATVEGLLNDALGPICAIILITGAGGMFGGVLRYSGIGAALSDSLSDLGLPLIVSAFLIATALRVAQGSATVALTTTAGLISAGVAAADLSDLKIVCLVLAIAAGATVLSHVNDSGFWLVSRFFGMDVKTTLRTWTVMETTLGVTIFLIALLLWFVVP
ncbi:GntP family permease [Ornithinimicrobium humiphilum]|uniref:GntP family gluconate:H+ symporter n=1 Tax=Ornithinimicrobium humiphilum TaxID=125288 RepID=A0A543K7S7_9MICO|nr:GntP family permease [Ornithinimicrobium humiphilum]TQM91139.1 GntP family gluconate:H+ symporter [Ornithinimicrobium humiphilum]